MAWPRPAICHSLDIILSWLLPISPAISATLRVPDNTASSCARFASCFPALVATGAPGPFDASECSIPPEYAGTVTVLTYIPPGSHRTRPVATSAAIALAAPDVTLARPAASSRCIGWSSTASSLACRSGSGHASHKQPARTTTPNPGCSTSPDTSNRLSRFNATSASGPKCNLTSPRRRGCARKASNGSFPAAAFVAAPSSLASLPDPVILVVPCHVARGGRDHGVARTGRLSCQRHSARPIGHDQFCPREAMSQFECLLVVESSLSASERRRKDADVRATGQSCRKWPVHFIGKDEWLLLGSGVVRPGPGSWAASTWCASEGGSS
jgi:hypothetical protein